MGDSSSLQRAEFHRSSTKWKVSTTRREGLSGGTGAYQTMLGQTGLQGLSGSSQAALPKGKRLASTSHIRLLIRWNWAGPG